MLTNCPAIQPVAAGRAAPRLPWLLRRLNQRYRAVIRAELEGHGLGELPPAGYWVLIVLAEGPRGAGELVTELGVSKQRVSKLVDTLVALGCAEREPKPSDRRRNDLSLTARGRGALEVIEGAVERVDHELAVELGPRAHRRLVESLERLVGEPGDTAGGRRRPKGCS